MAVVTIKGHDGQCIAVVDPPAPKLLLEYNVAIGDRLECSILEADFISAKTAQIEETKVSETFIDCGTY